MTWKRGSEELGIFEGRRSREEYLGLGFRV